jgi:hypothetical protein
LICFQCDGSSPCSRCKADNAICVFGERKKSQDKVYPKGYVEMLESQQTQLVTGLQELYKLLQNGQGWIGEPLETIHGQPLTHDILDRLGALKQDGHTTSGTFEEDFVTLQHRLIADGAGMMQRQPSHDSHSDSSTPSPIYEPVPQIPNFSNPFSPVQLPPTPPNRSPYPQNARAVPLKSNTYTHPTFHQSNLNWNTTASGFNDNMDFVHQFESPMAEPGVDFTSFVPTMYSNQLATTAINPCLTMKDWADQEDMQQYFNPAAMT